MHTFMEEKILGCENFSWKEALYLPRWNIYAMPADPQILENVSNFAQKLQRVRNFLGIPMTITSWYRPHEYNKLIGGAKYSWHKTGGAGDFRCPNISADELRLALKDELEEFGLRMENLPGSNWVHVDDKEPVDERFFRP